MSRRSLVVTYTPGDRTSVQSARPDAGDALEDADALRRAADVIERWAALDAAAAEGRRS